MWQEDQDDSDMHLETPGEKVLMGLVRTAKGGTHPRLHGDFKPKSAEALHKTQETLDMWEANRKRLCREQYTDFLGLEGKSPPSILKYFFFIWDFLNVSLE